MRASTAVVKTVRIAKRGKEPEKGDDKEENVPGILTVNTGDPVHTIRIERRTGDHVYWGEDVFDRVSYSVSVAVTLSVSAAPSARKDNLAKAAVFASEFVATKLATERVDFEREIRETLYPELFNGR